MFDGYLLLLIGFYFSSEIPKIEQLSLVTGKNNHCTIKGYTERNMIQQQHVDKGNLNKCILKASVDTIMCLAK